MYSAIYTVYIYLNSVSSALFTCGSPHCSCWVDFVLQQHKPREMNDCPHQQNKVKQPMDTPKQLMATIPD